MSDAPDTAEPIAASSVPPSEGDHDDRDPSIKDRATRLVGRSRDAVDTFRAEIPAVDAGWDAYHHDLEIGGPLITGAVAFRMFLWLLPATLVAVVGFGLLATSSGSSPESVAKKAGISGFAAQSISSATQTSTKGRWLLVGIGLIALISATRSLVKALWRTHELAWRIRDRRSPKTIPAVSGGLGLAVAIFVLAAGVSALRAASGSLAAGAIVAVLPCWFGLWLIISRMLPHGDAPLRALIPGAVLVAICTELLRALTIYYIAGKVNSSSALYGGLGAAAAMLGWFFLLGRVVVVSAVLNATLWDRHMRGKANTWHRRRPGATPDESD